MRFDFKYFDPARGLATIKTTIKTCDYRSSGIQRRHVRFAGTFRGGHLVKKLSYLSERTRAKSGISSLLSCSFVQKFHKYPPKFLSAIFSTLRPRTVSYDRQLTNHSSRTSPAIFRGLWLATQARAIHWMPMVCKTKWRRAQVITSVLLLLLLLFVLLLFFVAGYSLVLCIIK